MRTILAALKSLWSDGTKWAELFGGLGIAGWGGLHLAFPTTPGPHPFGAGMGWISATNLDAALLVVGALQAVTAVFGARILRIFTAAPAMFLTLDVVVDVLLRGEYPPGAIAIFATTCLMNLVSMIRNRERMCAAYRRHYA